MADSRREKSKFNLAYTPKTPFVHGLAKHVVKMLELNATIPFANEDELEDQFDEKTTLAGLIFNGVDADKEGPPLELSVTIRFPSEFRTMSSFQTEERLWLTRCSGRINAEKEQVKSGYKQDIYIREGFLQLQHQIFLHWYHQLLVQLVSNFQKPAVEMFNVHLRAAEEPCAAMSLARLPTFLYYFIYLLPFLNIIRVSVQIISGLDFENKNTFM